MAWNEPGGKGNPKDPWGNRGNNNGGNQPPDLDEVIRKLTDKFNRLLGGKPGNGNNGGDEGSIVGFLIVAAVIAVVLFVMNAFYTLDTQERGVVLQTG